RVRIWAALALPSSESRVPSPGKIVAASKSGIDIACGEGVLRILKLQRAGGRVISAADYLNARSELRA
ncbi:MAG TPA: methionyl-tRNA formyltransferase, partial [Rhodanobacteraceae bacterium]